MGGYVDHRLEFRRLSFMESRGGEVCVYIYRSFRKDMKCDFRDTLSSVKDG